MNRAAISVEHVSKRYRIGNAKNRYSTLRDRVSDLFSRRNAEPQRGELWALRDVNLEIGQGEVVGLLGHNGAGKSTLLKILTRITEPSEGQAVLRGRVASLLEVGTGFHPELTGRENIFLNGAILGMSRAEIRESFDAIVAFAEVEMFLDVPVKRYSSGMFVRLAFAVAAHLNPEILLVDEVLSVGDIEFQRRCLGRMNEVARSGRTVVFVSHNLRSIEDLCSRSVLLSRGTIERVGPTREVISHYLSKRGGSGTAVDLTALEDRDGTGRAMITAIELLAVEGDQPLDVVSFGEPFRVRLRFAVQARLSGSDIGVAVLNDRGDRVFFTCMRDHGVSATLEGAGYADCVIERPSLLPGIYFLDVMITDEVKHEFADHVRMVGKFEVVIGDGPGPPVGANSGADRGSVWVTSSWTLGGANNVAAQ